MSRSRLKSLISYQDPVSGVLSHARPILANLVDPCIQCGGMDRCHLLGLDICRGIAAKAVARVGLGDAALPRRSHVCGNLAFF